MLLHASLNGHAVQDPGARAAIVTRESPRDRAIVMNRGQQLRDLAKYKAAISGQEIIELPKRVPRLAYHE
jgi:hypothetical protein